MKKIILNFVLAMTFMLVMGVGVMATTCPSGTTPIHVETVSVSSSGSIVTSTNILESGVTYLLEASGTANAGDTIDFDAKYSITNRIVGDDWTDLVSGYVSYGPTLLELKVNGNFVDWGAYNAAHTYTIAMIGYGNQVALQIYDIYYPNNVGSLTVDIDKCVDITPPVITFEQPSYGSIHSGVIDLRATCNEDCDYVNFWWRAETQPFAWYRYHYVHDDGTVFKWDLNTLDAQLADGNSYLMGDGTYYLYAAGKDLAGNWARTPEIMVVVLNNKIVHGGGHMLEVNGDKRKDWLDISFGGFIGDAGTAGLVGEWQINFHNTNDSVFDNSRFHTTEITELNLYNPTSTSCTGAMNFKATGEWNGFPGYSIIFRAGDSSDPSSYDTDTVRVTLHDSNGVVYDTHWEEEFSDESSCVGTARTGLDTGNIIIQG